MTKDSEQAVKILRRVHELQAGVAVEKNSRFVFERYYRRLLGFFRRRDFSVQEAEELTQDSFLQVFEEIRSFGGRSSFDSWLFAVAANVCRNERRRLKREKRDAPEVSLDAAADGTGPRLEIVADQASPDRVVFETERREAVSRAVGNMPPQMRACLALHIDKDLKHREIAAVLKISIETVKAHLFQARQRLKDEVGEEFGTWDD